MCSEEEQSWAESFRQGTLLKESVVRVPGCPIRLMKTEGSEGVTYKLLKPESHGQGGLKPG